MKQIFGTERVLLPVIHPVSWDAALANVELVVDVGCPGIFLIDQGMAQAQVLELVLAVRKRFPKLWVGVNLLGLSPAAALTTSLDACEGRIDGLWTDNARVDERAASQPEAEALLEVRRAQGWAGLYFGGVAFKYQREVPDADLAHAARAAAAFMDVICTSGPGTGREARLDKLRTMRAAVGTEAAIALASGVTADNVLHYTPYVNAFLVGTGIEADFGILDRQKVATLQRLISHA